MAEDPENPDSPEHQDNPKKSKYFTSKNLALAMLLITIVSVVTAIYFGYRIDTLNQEINDLSMPYIIPQPLLTESKVDNVNFPFFIRNPSDKEYTIDFSQSTCSFETDLITKYIPNNTNETTSSPIGTVVGVIVSNSPPVTQPLNPRNQTEIICPGFSVKQAINDTNSFMDVCVKIIGLNDKICERIPITIARSKVITAS